MDCPAVPNCALNFVARQLLNWDPHRENLLEAFRDGVIAINYLEWSRIHELHA
jgi:hypothetical protein